MGPYIRGTTSDSTRWVCPVCDQLFGDGLRCVHCYCQRIEALAVWENQPHVPGALLEREYQRFGIGNKLAQDGVRPDGECRQNGPRESDKGAD